MLNDKEIIAASAAFERVIIRRPHAYRLAAAHTGAPIPGLAFVDASGKLIDKFTFGGPDDRAALLAKLRKLAAREK